MAQFVKLTKEEAPRPPKVMTKAKRELQELYDRHLIDIMKLPEESVAKLTPDENETVIQVRQRLSHAIKRANVAGNTVNVRAWISDKKDAVFASVESAT